MAASNPDISLIADYPGDFLEEILKSHYHALALQASGINVLPNIKSKKTLTKIVVRKGAKPYTGTFKSKPDVKYVPRVLEVEKCQRDLEVEPEKYRDTFLQSKRGKGENAQNLVFPEHVWDAVLSELKHEIVTDTIYHGVGKEGFTAYNAGTAYTVGAFITYTQDGELRYFECVAATTAGQNPDTHEAKWRWAGGKAFTKGFNYHFKAAVTNNEITPVVTGLITSEDALEQFQAVWRALPEVVRQEGGYIISSQNAIDCLNDAYEEKTKGFQQVNGISILPKTDGKCKIIAAPWLPGSNRIIATAANNLTVGTDQLGDADIIATIAKHYSVESSISFVLGTQLRDLEALAINDQD